MTDELTEPAVYAEPVELPDLLGDVSLEIKDGVTFDEWARLGVNLQRFTRSHQWWAGDWLLYGEERFGESAYQAVDLDVDQKTLQNYRWVSSRIPKTDRRPGLTWTHHRIAAELESMPQRRKVLKQAESEELSTRELQALVDSMKPAGDDDGGDRPAKPNVTFTLSFTIDRSLEKHGLIVAELLKSMAEAELLERGIDEPTVSTKKN